MTAAMWHPGVGDGPMPRWQAKVLERWANQDDDEQENAS